MHAILPTAKPAAGTGRRQAGFLSALLPLCGLLLVTAGPVSATGWGAGVRPSRAEKPLPESGGAGLPKGAVSLKATVADPTGDTLGTGSTQIDVTSFSADSAGGNLVLGVTFAGTISPPDSGQPNAIDGFIDIDADQNGATGDVPWTDFLSDPTTGMGNEFYVDLFTYSAADGAADLVDDGAELVVGRAPVSFTATSMTVQIPLTLIADDGAVNAATILGTFSEPTDKAPNLGSVASGAGGPQTEVISLQGGRFTVEVEWNDPLGQSGPGKLIDQSDDSAVLYFFSANNWEMLIKVLDGCDINGHYWVFFAATTDVGFEVTVTDTQETETRRYTNDLGHAADAVTDTAAFDTCP